MYKMGIERYILYMLWMILGSHPIAKWMKTKKEHSTSQTEKISEFE